MNDEFPVIRARLPEKQFEHDDPLELMGMILPGDEATSREMARCFIEEYALLGFPRHAVARLFESPAFYGTRTLALQHGRAAIEHLLDEVFGREGATDAEGA